MATRQTDAVMETVGLVHGLFDRIGGHVEQWASGQSITPQQAFMIRGLEHAKPMSQLAEERGCDPSSLTGMIDRIEKLGLVERVSHPDDRRVRMIQLTEAGKAARCSLEAHLGELDVFAGMTAAERTTFLELLRKASGKTGAC